MDEKLVKNLYFSLIADEREEKRLRALDALKRIDSDNVRILVKNGPIIADAIDGRTEMVALDGVMKEMQGLQMLDYWYDFIEVSAQAILKKALSPDNKSRKAALYGIRMMRIVTSAGFPITETSVNIVKDVVESDKSISIFAYDLLKEAKVKKE